MRSNNYNSTLIKSVVDKHGLLKYDDFVKKFNEKNRYIHKRDVIVILNFYFEVYFVFLRIK